MVNHLDHNRLDMNRDNTMETQVRADQKNAEILNRHKADFPGLSAWSDDEAPEEERSDMSNEEYSETEDNVNIEPATNSAAQRPLFFDGLAFYLTVSQVRERTVRSILALGMAKTLSTLRDQKQNESIATIEQHYPDFTCLPTNEQTIGTEDPPMDLLAALRFPSAITIAQHQSPLTKPLSSYLKVNEESCVSPLSLSLRGPG